MRIAALPAVACLATWMISVANLANAQGIYIGPGGVQIQPAPPVEEPEYVRPPQYMQQPHVQRYRPPPGAEDARRDEIRERMFELRSACEDGERRACVRLGIIIGENRERRAEWRHEHPELFWWDR
jgi:hypothetical protein